MNLTNQDLWEQIGLLSLEKSARELVDELMTRHMMIALAPDAVIEENLPSVTDSELTQDQLVDTMQTEYWDPSQMTDQTLRYAVNRITECLMALAATDLHLYCHELEAAVRIIHRMITFDTHEVRIMVTGYTRKIHAIKQLKDLTGWGLRQAKQAVEAGTPVFVAQKERAAANAIIQRCPDLKLILEPVRSVRVGIRR